MEDPLKDLNETLRQLDKSLDPEQIILKILDKLGTNFNPLTAFEKIESILPELPLIGKPPALFADFTKSIPSQPETKTKKTKRKI